MEIKQEEEIEMEGNFNFRKMKLIVLGQRAEPSTPTTCWKLHFDGNPDVFHSSVSARKLCANLWEFVPLLPQIKNPRPVSKKKKKKKGSELQTPQPANASSSRINVTDSLIQHPKSVDRITSHSHMKKLLKEQQINEREMDILQEIAEDKVRERNKKQDLNEVKGLIRSAQAKLESERKLQKHYESLHLKLARELFNVKSAFSNALKELERERKARVLLENLCDEFAKGIRDYEQEVQSLRHKPGMDRVDGAKPDPMIQHISEAWLDKRETGKNTVNENLGLDIEMFLRARHSNRLNNRSFLKEAMKDYSRRESFPISAHQDAPGREDSVDSDPRRFPSRDSDTKKSVKFGGSCSLFNSTDRVLDKSSSKGDKIHPECKINGDSSVDPVDPKQDKPMQKLKAKLTSPEIEEPESFLELPSGVKENTLKAKLLEARLESRKNRAVMAILEPKQQSFVIQ